MTGWARHAMLILALVFRAGVAEAQSDAGMSALPQPKGRVILTVTGAITRTNAVGEARFDRDMLIQLGLNTLTTSTTWTEGVSEFKGVLASDVLKAVGAYGDTITAKALNDYQVVIPVSDFERYGVLFALWRDDKALTIRTKGPIWPVYPRDDYPELRNRLADKKWIWQLATMDIQ